MEKVAVYPGSFDPITNGHLEIIRRGLKFFDRMIVLVAYNPNKNGLFSVEERMALLKKILDNEPRITVDCSTELLVEYVKRSKADFILRGLRAVSDFEYEFQMALINRRLNREVETMFLMTGFKWFYTSSRIIKEAASHGGSVKGLVPDVVLKKLEEKYGMSLNGTGGEESQ
jgi:pantetheine-phosphate adenylyltransferase